MATKALFLNCTLRKSPSRSQTQPLIDKAIGLFELHGVQSEVIRVIDHQIEQAYWEDWESDTNRVDEWPGILARIMSADIVIIATPITGGMCSSAAHVILEKMALLDELVEDRGQFSFYGKVAGVIVTGAEDGAHHVASRVLYLMSRLGFTVPPNSETYWLGPAGTGPGYIQSHGERHFHTNKVVRYMVENCTFFAQLLERNPIPTNLVRCAEEARAESDSETTFKANVYTPSLRYRRVQTFGPVGAGAPVSGAREAEPVE